jgi:hypothetical protein
VVGNEIIFHGCLFKLTVVNCDYCKINDFREGYNKAYVYNISSEMLLSDVISLVERNYGAMSMLRSKSTEIKRLKDELERQSTHYRKVCSMMEEVMESSSELFRLQENYISSLQSIITSVENW